MWHIFSSSNFQTCSSAINASQTVNNIMSSQELSTTNLSSTSYNTNSEPISAQMSTLRSLMTYFDNCMEIWRSETNTFVAEWDRYLQRMAPVLSLPGHALERSQFMAHLDRESRKVEDRGKRLFPVIANMVEIGIQVLDERQARMTPEERLQARDFKRAYQRWFEQRHWYCEEEPQIPSCQ